MTQPHELLPEEVIGRENFIASLHRVFRFPVIRRLWRYLLVVTAYTTVVVVYESEILVNGNTPPARTAEAVLSSLLFGLLLQFRTNTSYDRWYEGRKLWGRLINVSRNLMLKTAHVVRPGEEQQRELNELVCEFAVNLRMRLGDTETRPGHQPMATAAKLYALLNQWGEEGKVSTWQALLIDAELRMFMEITGACERIRSTPLVASYKGLLRKGIGIYLIGVPWLVVGDAGWFTVPITVAVSYVLIALELVADDIEDPFGYGPDDLKMDEIVGVIEASSGQASVAQPALAG